MNTMGKRTTIPLNGTWDIAEGAADAAPSEYSATVPVPGLVDLAEPRFADVAPPVMDDSVRDLELSMKDVLERIVKDPKREAFWYRRIFELGDQKFKRAILVVRKAKYGIAAWVNGKAVGEHRGNFTPALFEVTKQLKAGAENELVVRVGAGRDDAGASPVNGHDNEKLRYIPGIYDDVELVLSNHPRIDGVQIAPTKDLSGVIVRVAVDAGTKARSSTLTVRVREVGETRAAPTETAGAARAGDSEGGGSPGGREKAGDSEGAGETAGAEVGRAALAQREFPAGTSEVQVFVPIPEAKRWLPASPFLYQAEVETDGDADAVRFGMRTFELIDGRAYLNGRPYRLLGTNICMYRFFEDSSRGALPWNRDWARAVIREFKSMNWDSARFCIGFPPEFWYDIADEEGFLVQDEFPIWKLPERVTVEDIAFEFREWMRDRWNHPCVVIWDAQNETRVDEGADKIAEAIRAVRGLDLQNRPWDNGWAPPGEPSDPIELHPYVLSGRGYTLRDMAAWPPAPTANQPYLLDGPYPPSGMILNEYGWVWINRDGSECILTERFDVLGRLYPGVGNMTPRVRLYLYARTLAALTEYWRARGNLAGLQHFCGLGYSRPNGHTSDSFADVAEAQLEPSFKHFVGDAFAPVGIMLDLWDPPTREGDRITVPIVVTNDSDRLFEGGVTLTAATAEGELFHDFRAIAVSANEQAASAFTLALPRQSVSLELQATLSGPAGYSVSSIRDIGVGSATATPRVPQ